MYVPEANAEELRNAIGDAGAGILGNYSHCTFSIKGIGRFKPTEGANPTIGEIGKLEEVEEIRIETVCEGSKLKDILQTIKRVHPYEEPATDVYPIEVME